ncbi:AAA family ATPase [Ponticaulis koreensis]|uniref:AAA family ATPase n=1 Tax=Ponticaulis koreensis TaxID=1123045 RepID=UPI0003B6A66B|nr:AAA family ATPase [Ponticaulis koreensis]
MTLDVNDIHREFGIDAVRDVMDGAGPVRPREVERPVKASPFIVIDPSSLPARQCLYGRNIFRKYLHVTVAPGGVGKSNLAIAESLAMVACRNLLGQWVKEPLNVWYFNLEDPLDEIQRRFAAAIQHYGLKQEDLKGKLYIDSGRDQRLVMASIEKNRPLINEATSKAVLAEMQEKKIDVVIIDPFISSHAVNENDNVGIDMVAKEWARIADKANAAVHLIHHTRKASGDAEVNAESSRGGKALTDAARDVRTINRMTEEQGAEAGVDNHRRFFRVISDKCNLAPPAERSDWYCLESETLANGDSVGVVVPWSWPNQFDELTPELVRDVQKALAGQNKRSNVQASDWAGYAIAEVFGFDADDKAHKAKIKKWIAHWLKIGVLIETKITDEKGKSRPVLDRGEWQDV